MFVNTRSCLLRLGFFQRFVGVTGCPFFQHHPNGDFTKIQRIPQHTQQIPLVGFGKRVGIVAFQHNRRRLDSDLRRVIDFWPPFIGSHRWRVFDQRILDQAIKFGSRRLAIGTV